MPPSDPAGTLAPTPEDRERLLEALAAADEMLDRFLPDAEDRGWEALVARLKMVGRVVSQDSRSGQGPSGPVAWSRPARIGRYEILGELGSGGFGIVFRAFDPQLRRVVALKMPRPDVLLSDEARRRFLLEAQAAGGLDHPGIVPVYDSGEVGPVCFIASACCDGPDLAAWLKARTEAVPVRLAARLAARLADAVHYTHERGILHRDIKPSNVLLYREADESATEADPPLGFLPRLGDFGLARLADGQPGELTWSGQPIGSPPYMSPEQARGRTRDIGPATDVYALGALLYEILTGRPPFRGETHAETLRLVIEADPVAPRMLRSGLPRDLDTIVLKCLKKDPTRRYESAAALRDDLGRYLAGRSILARPSPPWERLAKAVRRHPAAATVLAMAAMLAIGGGATVLWSNARLRRYATELERQRDRADRLHYASELQLARRARDEGQLGRAQQLLREIRTAPDAPDDREFAWRYLWSSTRREVDVIGEADSVLRDGTLSADGRLLVVSDHAGGLSGFDRPGGRLLWTDAHSGERTVDDLAVDPRGRLLAVGYGEQDPDGSHKRARLELREAMTGRPLAELPTLPGRVVLELRLPDDGRLLAVRHAPPMGPAHAVALWELGEDPDHPRPRLVRQREGLEGVTLAPDGTAFVAREPGGRAAIYETATLTRRAELADAPPELTLPAWFAPDGLRVAAGHAPSRSVSVWDAATGRRLHVVDGFTSPVLQVALPRRGPAMLAVEASHAVTRLDLETGRKVTVFPASPDPAVVNTQRLDFTADGRSFLVQRSSYLQPDVIELRRTSDASPLATCPARRMGWCSFWEVLGPEQGGPALVVGLGRSAWRWRFDPASKPDPGPFAAHSDEAWALAYSPDGRILASGSNDTNEARTIRLWDARDGRSIAGWKGHEATVTGLAFSPDGRILASCSLDVGAAVRLWDPATGRLLATLGQPSAKARWLAFSPDGRRLAAAGNDGVARIWDVPEGRLLLSIPAHRDRLHGLAFSPDGRTLATASDDRFARAWSLPSGRLLGEHREPEELFAVAYSPDGRTLAVAGRSGMIALLDPATMTRRRTIRSDDSEIRALAFTPDGRTLAAAGRGRAIRLWDPATGQELLTLSVDTEQVNDLKFSPDGRTLAACDHGGRIRIFRADGD